MTKMALLVRIAHFRRRVRRMDSIPEKYMRAAEAGYGWSFNNEVRGKDENHCMVHSDLGSSVVELDRGCADELNGVRNAARG